MVSAEKPTFEANLWLMAVEMIQKMPFRVGLTGGIGSGKTTVAALFADLGIPAYVSDTAAKQLMTSDPELVAAITAAFGTAAYTETGSLDRAFLAQIVFNNPEKLAQLNSLVHPAVARDSQRWAENNHTAPYTLYESALLIQTGQAKALSKVIVVTAPETVRLERAMQRDTAAAADIQKRMKQQLSEAEMCAQAHFIINNDGKTPLQPQVLEIHHQLCTFAAQFGV